MEWQDIKTAPRNEEWILIFVPGHGIFQVQFLAMGTADWWTMDHSRGQYRDTPRAIGAELGDPTHWMPLPAPPTPLQKEQ